MSETLHVSFDVWNTLIKPNPVYAQARTGYLAERFDIDPVMVKAKYTSVKMMIDNWAEESGTGLSNREVFNQLFTALGVDKSHYEEVCEEFRSNFKRNPPIIFPELIKTLWSLNKAGITLSIGSNSNFISGKTMKECLLDTWGVDFSYYVFSDLVQTSKPSTEFFDKIFTGARMTNLKVTEPSQILHIGDHQACDVVGAQRRGMKALLIKTPDELPSILRSLVA